MNIGIDISQAVYTGTGVGRYTIGLVESILDFDTDNNWTFLFFSLRGTLPDGLTKRIATSRHRFIRIPLPPSILSFLWNTLHLIPVEFFTGPLDLFISSDWTEPPSTCKKMTVIHDLTYLRYPETVHPTILSTQKKRMHWVMKESTHIIATSNATAKDIESYLHIPHEKITSIYAGIDSHPSTDEQKKTVLTKYGIKLPFILAVGKIEPRKNNARLIEAFMNLNMPEWNLVFVGHEGWGTLPNAKKNDTVRFTGFVPDADLDALYDLCSFFAFPSLWEGFGHPIIEAMKHGKAVITSQVESLSEVAGGAALLCDPQSTKSIQDALHTFMTDEESLDAYEKKGYEHAQQFTWKRYYEGLSTILKKI